ncbi:HAMP domain-containing histidine kinase [Pseudoalteromonas sp. Isolate6]|uniref:histidine kinase dimerization/phospho-acceptor domain-containing protein n=1 Tax=Pseudoalteromonas sp. Isolate6 TaxID=2908527 RepID=UPI001EFC3634|nr:HAMP domain-containing sensor histidine kinase [Pseudoalteromonas sp. Isolate6]MCG9758928.1 HAMP domain-containing histidine kinase [Pseudoalteromonas sp. Isolate6]
MKSIRGNLVSTLSITITGVVVAILLATDLAVDSWIDSQFDKAMHTKVGMLMTLVSEDEDHLELHFSGEFLPEFTGNIEPEYYQIWLNDRVFARSDSLDLFSQHELPYLSLSLGESKVVNETLPDGRAGRIIYTRFIPQIHTLKGEKKSFDDELVIAYAASSEGLDFILWLIDIVFIVTIVCVVVFIRVFVRKTVDVGLAPLNSMNAQIAKLNFSKDSDTIILEKPVSELLPVEQSLNRFIVENRQLYLREKRLTSDISHELKTPITELINLAEVISRFPEDNELMDDFVPEVLRISQRMKNIVTNVMLLHKYEQIKLPKEDVVDVLQVVNRSIGEIALDNVEIQTTCSECPIQTNLMAVESIIGNLLKNAKRHRVVGSEALIVVEKGATNGINVRVSNQASGELENMNLAQLFEPLWQSDQSRSANDCFGLGLPIARAFAEAIDAELTVALEGSTITFTLTL